MRRAVLWIAVFLLITSGMSLPLVSLATGAVQVRGAVQARLAIQEGNMIMDGTPSKFVVSAPYVVAPHSHLADKMPGALCPPMLPHEKVASVAINVVSRMCPPPKLEGTALSPGLFQPQGPASGYFLKLGLGMGEMVITPQSFSMVSSLTPNIPRVWWDFFQRRSKFEIYVEILELMKRAPMTPFEIAFYARLNHKRTKEYVEFLVRSGYLHPVAEDGKAVYVLTQEGREFFDRFNALRRDPIHRNNKLRLSARLLNALWFVRPSSLEHYQ